MTFEEWWDINFEKVWGKRSDYERCVLECSGAKNDVSCEGCTHLIGRHCQLGSNHCTHMALDMYSPPPDEKSECTHEFDSDGGPCRHCGKTVVELMDQQLPEGK